MPIDPDVDRELVRLDSRLARVEAIPTTVAVMAQSVADIKAQLSGLTTKVEAESDTRMKEREKDSENRKTSLRWTIGTLLLCTGTVIGAVGLLLSAFGGHP